MTTKTKTTRTPATTKTVKAEVATTPTLIPFSAYVADFKARMDINNREVVALVKDLHRAGMESHKLLDQAVEASQPVVKAAQTQLAKLN